MNARARIVFTVMVSGAVTVLVSANALWWPTLVLGYLAVFGALLIAAASNSYTAGSGREDER